LHPKNDPGKDIERKCRVRPDLFQVGLLDGRIVASVMIGVKGTADGSIIWRSIQSIGGEASANV
jgi:hypothetical protein